ncbi:MAG: hypothetical protein K2X81_04755 [Candidatus Obscuribacterales bacterium]|nr:hypothetical protein [Candidatus Obscuribacterales bacterium]
MTLGENSPLEIILELPEHLDGPAKMPSGELVAIGDEVEHHDFSVGRVFRIATYHDELGILLCVEYADGTHKMLGLKFVKKL